MRIWTCFTDTHILLIHLPVLNRCSHLPLSQANHQISFECYIGLMQTFPISLLFWAKPHNLHLFPCLRLNAMLSCWWWNLTRVFHEPVGWAGSNLTQQQHDQKNLQCVHPWEFEELNLVYLQWQSTQRAKGSRLVAGSWQVEPGLPQTVNFLRPLLASVCTGCNAVW